MMISSIVLVASTLLLVALGVAGFIYGAIATGLGVGFLAMAWNGLDLAPDNPRTRRWARGLFFYSLVYVTALFVALAVDRLILGR
jgi:protoheme IX farnesyltransferase